MSLSAAHASTPCGAPAITSSVVSTPAARSRCAYATSSSWNTRRPRCTATRAAARRGPRGGRRLRSAARRRSRRLGPDRERHPTRLERLVQMRWASASRVRSRAVRSSSMGQNSHCAATPTPSCASGTGADRVPSRTLRQIRACVGRTVGRSCEAVLVDQRCTLKRSCHRRSRWLGGSAVALVHLAAAGVAALRLRSVRGDGSVGADAAGRSGRVGGTLVDPEPSNDQNLWMALGEVT